MYIFKDNIMKDYVVTDNGKQWVYRKIIKEGHFRYHSVPAAQRDLIFRPKRILKEMKQATRGDYRILIRSTFNFKFEEFK